MSYRKELLARAWKRSPLKLIAQGCSMVLAAGPVIHILGFQRDCQDNLRVDGASAIGVQFFNFRRWPDIPPDLQTLLAGFSARSKTGIDQMLDWGWRLWVGTRGGELAIVAWSRAHNVSQDFFFPIPKDGVLIWYTETLPEHRGRGLMALILDYMVQTLGSEGTRVAYATCAAYNDSSRRGIEKAHFKPIGRGIMRAGSGRGLVWFPKRHTT